MIVVQQNERPPKLTTFDVLTRLILPALTLVAVIVAQLQQQRVVLTLLLAFLFLSVAVGFYAHLKAWLRDRVRERQNERLAKAAFPKLKTFSRKFGEFVTPQRDDALHNIVFRELCSNNMQNFDRLHLPHIDLFQGFWSYLNARTEKAKPSLTNLLSLIAEFDNLVALYDIHCVMRLFEQFPQELQTLLTSRSKSSLESFRERFVAFLDDYSDFHKGLEESFARQGLQPRYSPRPKPLP